MTLFFSLYRENAVAVGFAVFIAILVPAIIWLVHFAQAKPKSVCNLTPIEVNESESIHSESLE